MDLEDKRLDPELGEGPVSIPLNNLQEALAEDYQDYSTFLLKGPPGSGKTTLLKRLAFDLASNHDGERPLPVFIELGGHRGGDSPEDWLAARWRLNFPEMPELDGIERDQPIIWLLDGLNELPDEVNHPRSEKIKAWKRWLSVQIPRHLAIISCRSADYLEELDSIDEQTVPHLTVQAMDKEKIEEFLKNRSKLNGEQAENAMNHIIERRLANLYNTPLMLTLLEDVLTPEGDFPDGRADLFVVYLLKLVLREAENQAQSIAAFFSPTERKAYRAACQPARNGDDKSAERRAVIGRENALFDALSGWSYQRQKAVYHGERQEVSFTEVEIENELKKAHGAETGANIYRAALALQLLIEGEGENSLRFRHHQFQEFFAARQLKETREMALAAAPWRPVDFNESLTDVRASMKGWQQLPPVDRSGWEETARLAAELAEPREVLIEALAAHNLPLAGQCAAKTAVAENVRAPLAEGLLARMRDENADLRARIAAGHALGEMEALEVLGYRAIDDKDGKRIAWLPPLVEIPAGEYIFGSQDDPDAYYNETRFNERLAAFALGQYAVTNAEWRYFVEAGGYREEKWWQGKAAEAFFKGEGTNEGQAQYWILARQWRDDGTLEDKLNDSGLEPDLRDWVRETTALDEEAWQDHLAEVRGNAEKVVEPNWWRSDRYNNPLQPVVGISLFEAHAYCRWLSDVSGMAFTLPNEMQWEAAARGKGPSPRRYAFGEKVDENRCNILEPGYRVGAPTPVGLYQAGKTPNTDLYEMTGNVWDWTSSEYRERPPYSIEILQAIDNAELPRVVRGGGWDDILRNARAACRNDSHPGYRSDLLGCRVCAVPPLKSES